MLEKHQKVQNLDIHKLDKAEFDKSPKGTRPIEDNWHFQFKWGRINFSLRRIRLWSRLVG